ncbi:MAG: RNA polymerase factor sigma-54 [Candidatus Omnitrophica bacterium]|nr:RNA polymerase factor sigma-54 [Candidatus Omnitrophota bacterium]
MPLQLKPINKLTYKLRLTPQMRLSINLLQLPLVKLQEFVKQQAEENPLLDLESADSFSKSKEKFQDNEEEKKNYLESLITRPTTLADHLLRQLRLLTDAKLDQKIGELIIGNIDADGYLRCSLEDIAESANTITSSAEGGSLTSTIGKRIEKVLFLIQTFDPIGVGSRNLRECLLIQIKAKGQENSLAGQIADKYLPFLEKKRYKYIAKKLKISVEKIKEAMKEIAALDPKPGRAFNNEKTNYLKPDAVVRKSKDGYEVIMNDWELPHITLNDKYKQMIKRKDTPQDAKEYLKERLKAARVLINAVHKRKETVQKVIEDVVYAQKDFFDKGAANFKPMTLEQIAKRIGKHKSTVSRAIANKYLQTAYGIFEVRNFLNSGVKQENGVFFSSKTIKSKIKDLIENENKEKPLADQKISKDLKQEGISVSRRTIVKYRKQLKILPSKSRR